MYSLVEGGYPYTRQTLVASSLGDASGGEPRREPDLPGGERDRLGGVGRQDGGPAGTRLLLDYPHGRLPSSPYFYIAARFARSVRPPFGGPGLLRSFLMYTTGASLHKEAEGTGPGPHHYSPWFVEGFFRKIAITGNNLRH
jgi:hypothetical protein